MHARKDRERNDFINELKQGRINATEVKEVPKKYELAGKRRVPQKP